jgi:hypothetical protein
MNGSGQSMTGSLTPGMDFSPPTYRPNRVAAADDGWKRIAAFYTTDLQT